jgi:hypothetical protein
VARAAAGDDDALFDAVLVDTTAMHAEPIAERIAYATITGDRSFLDKLAKAITKTRAKKPKKDLNDLRFSLALLDDVEALEKMTHLEVHDLLIEDLELHPSPGKDTFSSLRKLIQKRKTQAGN